MIKGVIFDLDGTTIYTLADIHNSLNMTLKEYGYPEQSLDAVRLGVGSGFINLLRAVLPKTTAEERIREIADRYKEVYSEHLCVYSRPYDGIDELLESLQKKGIKLGVNSNKSDKNTKRLISTLFPQIDFTMIVGMQDGIRIKPDPEGALMIVKAMGLKPEEVVYAGDSEPDIVTAQNGGMKSAACLWGYRDEETLRKLGPDVVASDSAQLLELIERL